MTKSLRIIFYFLIFSLSPSLLQAAGTIDFNRDIRPIFSDKCFTCHGPHEEKRKGHLRLDTNKGKDSAFRIHKDSQAFKPGSLEDSEAWHRINTDDEDDVMPPLKTHKTLSVKEKDLIKKWIEEGTPWADHWSYTPPKKSALPDLKDKTRANKPLDYFIMSKLEGLGLGPSKEAPRHKLIRRVAYDLTGLPPTLAEIDAFENDKDPKAYEKIVDRYLQSKHYGERMALNWMDLARYGDTSVYHADGPRDMWPWRDWVIEAFNDNMPYDQFSIMQLAGDLIPNPTYEQKLATAFLRNNGTTDEGGAFEEEYRVTYAVDRTVTTAKVWMGLTMECAQCHDHKYDPLPQKDFYRMYAFFNISEDKGLQTRTGNAEPMMKILSKGQRRRLDELEEMLQPYIAQQEQVRIKSQPVFKKWAERENAYGTSANLDIGGMVHHFPLQEKESKLSRDLLHPEIKPEGKKKPKSFTDPILKGMTFYNKDNLKFKHAGQWLDRETPFSFSFWLRSTMAEQSASLFSKMNENDNFKGFDCWIENHRVGIHLIHEWPINSIKVL